MTAHPTGKKILYRAGNPMRFSTVDLASWPIRSTVADLVDRVMRHEASPKTGILVFLAILARLARNYSSRPLAIRVMPSLILATVSRHAPRSPRKPRVRCSPDGRWIAMQYGPGVDAPRALFVMPARDGKAPPQTEWIPILDSPGLHIRP
jgi:hypothetical protein